MLYRLLVKQAKTYGEKIAVAGEQRSLTFKELSEEVTATAAYFQACGASIGDPIILGLPPSPEFYVAFYAAAAVGMIVLPVLPSGWARQTLKETSTLSAEK